MTQSVTAFVSHEEDWPLVSEARRNRPKSLKQTAPLLNYWQQVWVSRVLGDDYYKRMSCVSVACSKTFTAQWRWVPIIVQNLQPVTGNVNFSIWVNNSLVGWTPHPLPPKKYNSSERIFDLLERFTNSFERLTIVSEQITIRLKNFIC